MLDVMAKLLLVVILSFITGCAMNKPTEPKLLGVEDLLAQPEPPADFSFSYGVDPLQFAELRLPAGEGRCDPLLPQVGQRSRRCLLSREYP